MADRSMKAVIRAELDPRGVVRGVSATQRELQKLNASTASVATSSALDAAMNAGRMALSMLERGASAVNNRVDDLTKIATTFNVDAANAQTRKMMREYADKKRIAGAIGPDVAKGLTAEADAFQKEADRIVKSKTIGPGIAGVMTATAEANRLKNEALDTGISGVGAVTTGAGPVLDKLREISESFRELLRKVGTS